MDRSGFIRPGGLLGLLLGVLLLVGGCSSSDPAADEPGGPDEADGISEHVETVVGPLRLVKEEYRDAVRDGVVIDTGEYRESRMFAREARRAWRAVRDTAAVRLDEQALEGLDRDFDELVNLVEDRGTIGREEELVKAIRSRLDTLGGEVPRPLRGVVESIRRADADLGGERSVGDYRIGVALTDPAPLYRDGDVVSSAPDAARQLRVLVREKRTKRPVPDAAVSVRWSDTEGTPVTDSPLSLQAVWGPYFFDGANVDVPARAAELRVNVEPPRVARHADMKGVLTRGAEAAFEVHRDGGTLRVSGPEPAPVPEDYELASDVSMALGEALLIREARPYRIGFIAEHAEPFWFPRDKSETVGKMAFRLADYPEDANRHLEALVLEHGTNRIVPGARVRLRLEPLEDGEVHRFELPFLMAAFHHYGNSVVLPPGQYRGRITVGRPDVLTLNPDAFPERRRVTFTWNAGGSGAESDSDGH